MNKHQNRLDSKENSKDYEEFNSFSFFQFFLRVIVILNLFMSLLLIYDYFMAPKITDARCGSYYGSQFAVYFPNGKYDNVLINPDIGTYIKGGEPVKYYSTPIFNHNKYMVLELENNREIKINDYELGFVLLFIITNALSFVLLILFPAFFDKWAKNYDDSLVSFLIRPYNYFKYAYVMFLLAGVPIIMGLYYMYQLYIYFNY